MPSENVYHWIRVSDDPQYRYGKSSEEQKRRLAEYSSRNENNVVREFIEVHSGKRSGSREVYKGMMRSLKKNSRKKQSKIHRIIFTDWSRLARNVADTNAFISQLHGWGVSITVLEELTWPPNEDVLKLRAEAILKAQLDGQKIIARTKTGIHGKRKAGMETKRPPFGYVAGTNAAGDRVFEQVTDEAQIVLWAFSEAANTGKPLTKIYEEAAVQGYPNKYGAFLKMFSNPSYCGKIAVHGGTDWLKEDLVEANYDGIVDEVTFFKAYDNRCNLHARKAIEHAPSASNSAVLVGRLSSRAHHTMMTINSSSGGSYRYYLARGGSGKADSVSIGAAHDAVLRSVKQLSVHPMMSELVEYVIRQEYLAKRKTVQQEIQEKEAQLVKKDKQADKLIEAFRKSIRGFGLDKFELELGKIQEEKDHLNAEIEKLRSPDPRLERGIRIVRLLLTKPTLVLQKLPVEMVAELVRVFFPNYLVIEDDRVDPMDLLTLSALEGPQWKLPVQAA